MDKLAEAKEEIESLEQQKKDLFSTAEQLYSEKESLKTTIADLHAEINRLKSFESLAGETEALRSKVNTLTTELNAAKSREHSMAADYAKLSKDYEAMFKEEVVTVPLTNAPSPVNTGKVTKVGIKK